MFRIPVLLTHFIEHRLDNSSITFSKFLYQHYHDDDGNDKDNHRDEQLPFKSQDHGSTSYSHLIQHQNQGILISPVYHSESNNAANYREPYLPSACLNRIWQPPKFS